MTTGAWLYTFEMNDARARDRTLRRFASNAEADPDDARSWQDIPAEERVLMVWRLSVEQWCLHGAPPEASAPQERIPNFEADFDHSTAAPAVVTSSRVGRRTKEVPSLRVAHDELKAASTEYIDRLFWLLPNRQEVLSVLARAPEAEDLLEQWRQGWA